MLNTINVYKKVYKTKVPSLKNHVCWAEDFSSVTITSLSSENQLLRISKIKIKSDGKKHELKWTIFKQK